VATPRDAQPPPDERPRRRSWRHLRAKDDSGTGPKRRSAATEQEQLIVSALADLRDMDVREVMTPRVDVVALTIPVRADDVARAVRESGHSCFPVVHDDLDHLVGILYVNDLFRTGRPADQPEPGPLDISRRLRQPLLIPESQRVLDALAEMRKHRRTFAVVVDEYGGVAGVLTVRDLLEPLVGDLRDEFDPAEEPEVVRVDANRWLIDGRASIDEVNERLDVELPEGEYVTLGGFLFDRFGHIPEEGECWQEGDDEFRVVEMDRRRIAKVVVARPARAPAPSQAEQAAPTPPPSADRAARPQVSAPTGGTNALG